MVLRPLGRQFLSLLIPWLDFGFCVLRPLLRRASLRVIGSFASYCHFNRQNPLSHLFISLDLFEQNSHHDFVKKPFNTNQNRAGNRPNMRHNNSSNARPSRRVARPCPDVARDAAARLVWKVLEEGSTLDEAMVIEAKYAELSGRDRSFAAAIVKSTLRYLGHIDILIAQYLAKPLPDTAFYVRALLRIGVAQYLSDLAPVHAIIDRSVELAKSDKVAFGMSGLINAVLRKITAQETKPKLPIIELLPANWRARYKSFYGEEKTEKIASALLNFAPIDLSLKDDLSDIEREKVKIDFGAEIIGKNSLRIGSLPEDLLQIPSWQNGDVWVQDAAAALPVAILKPQKGEDILDMCAAPGGKTMQIAAMGAKVAAIDVSEDRLKLVAQNMARTKLNAKLIKGDARELSGEGAWDAILLDAPCTATGTLRRNLETLWIKTPFDMPKLLEMQAQLIGAAARGLKSGGRLVYAVCSMEPEEADLAIAAAIDAGLKLDPICADEAYSLAEAVEERGTIRLLPYMLGEKGGLDGFFIARFIKP